MLLAAGLGTRLRPLTHDVPKALVPVDGVPILERIALRLIAAGADRLVINVHHLGDRIRDYVARQGGWGVEVAVSEEPERPLETGGGLLHAAPLIRRDAPFFLHNTDVITDLPLREMYDAHAASGTDVTLAVMRRETARRLLFDDQGLVGRVDAGRGLRIEAREAVGRVHELAFAGVHVISPRFLDRLRGNGAFSILEPYMELAAAGGRIGAFRIDGCRWIDIGRPEQLERAAEVVREMEG